MREDEYRRLDEVDESLWWLVGLRQLILALIARHGPGARRQSPAAAEAGD